MRMGHRAAFPLHRRRLAARLAIVPELCLVPIGADARRMVGTAPGSADPSIPSIRLGMEAVRCFPALATIAMVALAALISAMFRLRISLHPRHDQGTGFPAWPGTRRHPRHGWWRARSSPWQAAGRPGAALQCRAAQAALN